MVGEQNIFDPEFLRFRWNIVNAGDLSRYKPLDVEARNPAHSSAIAAVMVKGKFTVDPSLEAKMHQYQIVGRAAPTNKNPTPKIYRMRSFKMIFARNVVLAKSRFWYFMKRLNKAKKRGGELLSVNELFDTSPTKVKNYGIWLRYDSRTNTHNMYKAGSQESDWTIGETASTFHCGVDLLGRPQEFRNVNINGAVGQLYQEMAGRHRADPGSIQIIHVRMLRGWTVA
eukprot:Skav205503  [mRNA]  locus=scaffold231:124228:131796:+ [translate_table: standard]